MEQRQYCFELLELDEFPGDGFPSLFRIRLNYQLKSFTSMCPVAVMPTIGIAMEGLRMTRIESGATQDDVAKSMGIKKAAVSRLENSLLEERELALSTLQKYATALGYELHIACVPKSEQAIKEAEMFTHV